MDDSEVVWPEVTGLCGFWDGSCCNDVCGAGMLIKIFTHTLGDGHDSQELWACARTEFPRC